MKPCDFAFDSCDDFSVEEACELRDEKGLSDDSFMWAARSAQWKFTVTAATVELPAIEASRRAMQPTESRSSPTGS